MDTLKKAQSVPVLDLASAVVLFPVIVTSLAMMLPFYIAAILYRRYRSKYE